MVWIILIEIRRWGQWIDDHSTSELICAIEDIYYQYNVLSIRWWSLYLCFSFVGCGRVRLCLRRLGSLRVSSCLTIYLKILFFCRVCKADSSSISKHWGVSNQWNELNQATLRLYRVVKDILDFWKKHSFLFLVWLPTHHSQTLPHPSMARNAILPSQTND